MKAIDDVKSLLPREFIIPHLENNTYIYGQMPPCPSAHSTPSMVVSRYEVFKRSPSPFKNSVLGVEKERPREWYESPKISEIYRIENKIRSPVELEKERIRQCYDSPKISDISRIENKIDSPIGLERVQVMKQIEKEIDRQILDRESFEESKGKMRISELEIEEQIVRRQAQVARALNTLREESEYVSRPSDSDFQQSRYQSRLTDPNFQASRYSTQTENYEDFQRSPEAMKPNFQASRYSTQTENYEDFQRSPEAMKEVKFSSIESPNRSLLESPNRSLLESPNRSLLESPNRSILKSPNRSILKSPNRSLLESPNRSILKSPNRSLVQSTSSPLKRSITFTDPSSTISSKVRVKSHRRSSKTPSLRSSTPKYQHMSNLYSKYNTKSPYAKSTFSHEVHSIDNQKYTYSTSGDRYFTPHRPKHTQKRPRTSLRSFSSHKRTETQEFMSQLLKAVESHSSCCGDLRNKVAKLKRDYLPLSSKYRQ